MIMGIAAKIIKKIFIKSKDSKSGVVTRGD
jgi:hypothetical protein